MPEETETIRLHTKLLKGVDGVVDKVNSVIKGVSLITGNLEAEGHKLFVDDTTLSQLHALGSAMGQIPVKLDHGGGVTSINGYIDNVRLDGNKWRGDWNLLTEHKETKIMLERAARQPGTFGMSVAFKGPPKGVKVKGKACARAEKLLSVDCVDRAAANPDGMFSAKDDEELTLDNNSSPENTSETELFIHTFMADPTLQDVLNATNKLNARLDSLEKTQGEIVNHINTTGGDDVDLNDVNVDLLSALHNASDDELAQWNKDNNQAITREQVDGAVTAYNNAVRAEQQNPQQDDVQQTPEQIAAAEKAALMANQHRETNPAPAPAAVPAAVAAAGPAAVAAFSALNAELIELRARLDRRDAAEIEFAEQQEFASVEEKIEFLAKRGDQAIEFAKKVVAKNEALEVAFKTGTRPVKAGIDNGVRLFSANEKGELHPFQVRVKELKAGGKTEGEAIQFASKEDPARHNDYLTTLQA